ncbi:MAG TPA: hypothetical protein VEY67_03005 [Candidatus Dormibacteraeota bacterium]|nr:hypothetical protein [Candidatus Dormibacteraeota bacterium]
MGVASDPPPRLVVNPSHDGDFVIAAHALLADAAAFGELESALRGTYPHTVVHQRVLDGETERVWYVYRDGRWSPPRAAAVGDER